MSASLPVMVALPFVGAAVLALVPNEARRTAAWIAGLFALAAAALAFAATPAVLAGESLRWRADWVPALGLELAFRLDGLAWLFALLVTGIGALVVLYAAWYLGPDDPPARFFMFLMLFMGAMLGVVTASNLLLLAVFWEATSLSSFLLIGYWRGRDDARQGARMALTITGAGGLALLGGVLIIGHIVGSFDLDVVLAAGDAIRAHPLYVPALVLVLLGAFTKSAQFPFHFWLPNAMAAPTPVSAYLHSATMVKAGVFLLARFYPALSGTDLWFYLVGFTGLATLVVGAWYAIFQHDLKGLLAYSTISQLGLITMMFGFNEPLAVVAGVFHIINHATFKAGLFMAAGIIDHETGSRDMRRLNGLWSYMPLTATLATVAAAAMAGVPLANGFLSKEMFLAATLEKDAAPWVELVLPLGAGLASILAVAYSARFIHDTFFNGEPHELPNMHPHDPPLFMWVPVAVLVLLVLAVGLAPRFTVAPFLAASAQATLQGPLPEYSLAIWHGFNWPLAMSAAAFVGGFALYFGLQKFINLHRLVPSLRGGRTAFFWMVERVQRGAAALTDFLQNGSLQRYLVLLVSMALVAGALPFLQGGQAGLPGVIHLRAPNWGYAAVMGIGMVAAVATVLAYRHRLQAIVLVGAVGLVVSLTFVFLAAPDLALTQLLVEMVTVVLLMLALRWLPQQSPPEPARARQWRDALIALAAGVGMCILMLLVVLRPFDSISPYFLATSVPEGGGANVVNVILVDYRGYDTLGEITVLGIAGLIIVAALRDWHPAAAALPGGENDRRPLLLALVSRALLPFALLVSIYFFLRGHNLPGGGFIAALVLATGLILLYVANGAAWVGERLRIDFAAWIGLGLLVAVATGVGAWFLGSPFLTSTYDYPKWPVVGAVPLASAALFDLGVYLTVVGAAMSALVALARLGHEGRAL
ncbi:MAG TPA: monovalent cation/H+ antiporter subunit A [Burkholderiaceae bacterium]|nr:monovalent cation/H+ antiporter subunit A [Burkholderiaceae bacterium]HRZ01073.1 monovalent cation/H+ antiporter subunit A [Burkholderiaceae bacterium]